MPKIKAKTFRKLTIPVPKAVMTQHHLKVGDVVAGKVKVTNHGLVFTPNKKTPTARVNGRTRIQKKNVAANDSDREQWMTFVAKAFDSSFGDEPAYTSYTIKVPNPEYEKR